MDEILVAYGGPVKTLGNGRVGGYGITFSEAGKNAVKDLSGEYFTKSETYYGARGGDGADCLFHHGFAVCEEQEQYSDRLFAPVKAKKDAIGIFVETVLDMRDEYEKAVYDLAAKGKLGWSSGAAAHMVQREADGKLTRWPISEFSLTPTPAEPRNSAMSLKSFLAEAPRMEIKLCAPDVKSSGLSVQTRCDILQRAICAQAQEGSDSEYPPYCYICDLYDNSVVWQQDGVTYEASYTIDGLMATLGKPSEVMRLVTYRTVPGGNAKHFIDTERDFERFLRDAGFSRSQAVALTSGGYKALRGQREADPNETASLSAQDQAFLELLELSLTTGVQI